jgi:hypothetical protein
VNAIEPTTPWAMYLTDEAGLFRFIAFDFDGKTKGVVDDELMERAIDQADALSTLLTSLNIRHVVCESSGTGGRHIWVAIRDGAPLGVMKAITAAAKVTYSTLDFGMLHNVGKGAVRPPLSPHRDGSRSIVITGTLDTLLNASTTLADLGELAAALTAAAPPLRPADTRPSGPVDASHQTHRPLPAWGLGHMSTIGGGSNPSWTAFMCLRAAVYAGWDFADIEQAVRDAPGMEHYRTKNTGRGDRVTRSPGDALARLERQWDKAHQYAILHHALPRTAWEPTEAKDLTELSRIVADVDGLLSRLAAAPGRWGSSEAGISQRTILTALAYLTLQTGKRVVAASIRDLALMCGLGRTTAADALIALAAAGFAHRVSSAEGGNAAEWTLGREFSTGTGTLRSQPLINPRPPSELFPHRAFLIGQLEDQLTDQRHDLFTRQGLGHLAGRVYALLAVTPSLTVQTAAKLLGVTSRWAATVLSRLRHHRLVILHKAGWARSKQDLRAQAAKILGVAGVLVDRANRYRAERDVWAWWQAEVTTMRTAPQHRPRRPHVSSRTLFESTKPGERVWPRYPRDDARRGDHKSAAELVLAGVLTPGNRWQYLGDVA